MDNLNYGVIGNCCTAALISEKGSIEWLCFPNFDSPSISVSYTHLTLPTNSLV